MKKAITMLSVLSVFSILLVSTGCGVSQTNSGNTDSNVLSSSETISENSSVLESIISSNIVSCENVSSDIASQKTVSNDKIEKKTIAEKDKKYNSEGKLLIYTDKYSYSPDFTRIYSTVDELYNESKNIVYGTVKTVKRNTVEMSENSLYKFDVIKSYKGEIKANSVISVSCSGAWVPYSEVKDKMSDTYTKNYTKSELKNALINLNKMGAAPAPLEGEKFMLFLGDKSKSDKYWPVDTYPEDLSFMGRFYYVDGKLTRFKPGKEPNIYQNSDKKVKEKFTLKELETEISKCK